jgi:5-hydroxyisourate hydrolase
MSSFSTHVLDTSLGTPAQGIPVTLEREGTVLASTVTDADGRVREFAGVGEPLKPGNYRLSFSVADYFRRSGRKTIYLKIVIDFAITGETERYHIPLLLSPFGYTTYRGS